MATHLIFRKLLDGIKKLEKEKIVYILHNVWGYGFVISMLTAMVGVVTQTFDILAGAVILATISVGAKFFENQLIKELKMKDLENER